MANLLQSSQNKATTTPQFYTDYLSNIASKGQQAACQAQYVGAQPLQTQAFEKVCENFGKYQPDVQQGQSLAAQAGAQNITGAAQPFLQAGTSASPLAAMQPYAQSAMAQTGYCASIPLVGQGAGLSGLSAAAPFLGRAASTGGACASSQYVNKATGLSAPCAAAGYLQEEIGRAHV